jgi:hypothetical protein
MNVYKEEVNEAKSKYKYEYLDPLSDEPLVDKGNKTHLVHVGSLDLNDTTAYRIVIIYCDVESLWVKYGRINIPQHIDHHVSLRILGGCVSLVSSHSYLEGLNNFF